VYVTRWQVLTMNTGADRMLELDITPKIARALKIFLEDPAQPHYGYEITKRTGLASGTLSTRRKHHAGPRPRNTLRMW
jgi:hypothetical protein